MKRQLNIFALVAILAGCATLPPPATPEEIAAWRKDANRPIICRAGPECDRLWNRAYDWVRDNNAYGIKTANSRTIDTYRPRSKYETAPNHGAIRAALGNGQERIEFEFDCHRDYRCDEQFLRHKATFVRFMLDRK